MHLRTAVIQLTGTLLELITQTVRACVRARVRERDLLKSNPTPVSHF